MLDLKNPWLVAAWPGMGGVAVSAASFLVETLRATPLAAIDAAPHFDIDRVQMKDGVVVAPRLPRTQLYGWKHPSGGRDLVILVGEAQPTVQPFAFCERIVRLARDLGVQRVITFASMVLPMHPTRPSRVHAVATSRGLLEEVERLAPEARPLGDGEISGLNGTLLAAALDHGLDGVGLLAEVPQVGIGVPYLKAARAVLEAFSKLAGVALDLRPVAAQAELVERGLVDLMERVQKAAQRQLGGGEEGEDASSELVVGGDGVAPGEEADEDEEEAPGAHVVPALSADALARIEELFQKTAGDRSWGRALKAELDKAGVFREYEDRFLNLFSTRSPNS